MKGVVKYKKNTSRLQNHILHVHANKFSSFLTLPELRKTLQPDDASQISTDDGRKKRRKSDEVSVGGRLSDYLLPCHFYGDNNPNQMEFEGNSVALMSDEFTSLWLMDQDCFCKLTQDLGPRLHPVG